MLLCRSELALLLQCLERGKTSFPKAREQRSQFSIALWIYYAWLLWSPEVTEATDFNIYSSCSWITDPDMVLGNILYPDSIVDPGKRNDHRSGWFWQKHGSQVTTSPQVVIPALGVHVISAGNTGLVLQHRPQLPRTTNPDMVFGSNMDVNIASGDSADHTDQHSPSISVTVEPKIWVFLSLSTYFVYIIYFVILCKFCMTVFMMFNPLWE